MIKLLHVEDDADIREITSMALSMAGNFDVVQCSSGQEALETVESFMPDLLLLDMMMPGMTGRQTLDAIRQKPGFENIPAIFMTARAQHSEIEALLEAGATEVISKPFDPLTLSDQIMAAMNNATAMA